MDGSMPGFSVLHYLPKFVQIYPLSWWSYLTISSSATSFFFCLQSFPALGSFQMSCLFASGGPTTGASASTSVLPMNIQGWLPLGLIDLISLQSKGLSRVFSSSTIQKHQFFSAQPLFWSNSHIYPWLLEKPMALTIWTFVSKVMPLLFNMLSSLVIVFLPRSKCLNFMAAVIIHSDFGAQEHKICHCFQFSPSTCHEMTGPDALISVFLILIFKSAWVVFPKNSKRLAVEEVTPPTLWEQAEVRFSLFNQLVYYSFDK